MPVFSVFNALFSELWQTSSNARNLMDFFFFFFMTHLELVRLNVGIGLIGCETFPKSVEETVGTNYFG